MIPGMTPLKLDVLMNEGLIFCDIGSRTRVMNYGSRQEQSVHEESRTCYVTPAGFRAVDSDFAPIIDTTVRQAPVEITESLNRLRADFPDNTRLAFIMMRFGSTSAHQRIHASVRAALSPTDLLAYSRTTRNTIAIFIIIFLRICMPCGLVLPSLSGLRRTHLTLT